MKRIKILVRKNLKMTEGKVAAQVIHAALGLAEKEKLSPLQTVIVLLVSDKNLQKW